MLNDWPAFIAAFDAECRTLTDALTSLDESEFARSTNCPPWTLHELVAHICFSACTFRDDFPTPAADSVLVTAADYYRRAERSTEEYRIDNVRRTQQAARRFSTGAEATNAVASAWQRTRSWLEGTDPELLVAGRANIVRDGQLLASTAMTLQSYAITRLIALSAHAVDVALTLSRPAWTTNAAADAVTPALLELLGGENPLPMLGWDHPSFLAAATGRRALTTRDQRVLGERAASFPLLS